jgi:hypothetical protein
MGKFHAKGSLKQLGLVIQLGHNGGAVQADFVIVDTSRIHNVSLQYRECYQVVGASQHDIQLLQFSCFPSTVLRPCTAFTFNILETFHAITLQGKLSAYDFYQALLHKTDNTGLDDVKASNS